MSEDHRLFRAFGYTILGFVVTQLVVIVVIAGGIGRHMETLLLVSLEYCRL